MLNLCVNVCPEEAWNWTGGCFLVSLMIYAHGEVFPFKILIKPTGIEHEQTWMIPFQRPATNDQITRRSEWNVSGQSRYLFSVPFLVSSHSSWRLDLSVLPPTCWDMLFAGSEGHSFCLFAQWLLEHPTFFGWTPVETHRSPIKFWL